ncbi:MAG: Crp/Fnr family transcriptional regulator [Burkholderiales bacterium]|nr:Crp/Fnr family transcriptional regulator [Burkholderiales bacterium]
MAAPDETLPDELRALLPAALHGVCEWQLQPRGALLFQAGRRPTAMYFVDRGEVLLQRVDEDGDRLVLQRTRHGIVGEASLQSERYHCDAVVAADAVLTRIPRQALLEALQADAAFALRWIGMLNTELRRLRQQCERLGLRTVQARLLHLVRTEGGADGLDTGSGLKVLAHSLGITHEALYRGVAALEQQGQLERRDGRLRLARRRPARPGA